jgi:hypothetical protein
MRMNKKQKSWLMVMVGIFFCINMMIGALIVMTQIYKRKKIIVDALD